MKTMLTWNVCRVCLWENDELHSIYEKDGQDEVISDKISLCGGINIEKESNLPSGICQQCIEFLNIAYKFHINCQNSDKVLREYIDFNLKNNLSQSFTEYIAKVNCKFGAIEENVSSKHIAPIESDKCTENSYVETYIVDTDDHQTGYDGKNNGEETVTEFVKVEICEADDPDIDEEWLKTNALSSDSELRQLVKKKRKPMRRKRSRKKPVNTITLGLDNSEMTEEGKTEDKPIHICEVCGNKYTKKFSLDNHMKWHRDEKPFACEICGKMFSINFQLTRHMRSHTGQKPYDCKFCDRKFSDLSTRIKHQRTHTNERPFKCDTCGKAFNYSHVLKVHMAVHTGEKPYTCNLCGKAFSQLHHLKAHLNTLAHQNQPTNLNAGQREVAENLHTD